MPAPAHNRSVTRRRSTFASQEWRARSRPSRRGLSWHAQFYPEVASSSISSGSFPASRNGQWGAWPGLSLPSRRPRTQRHRRHSAVVGSFGSAIFRSLQGRAVPARQAHLFCASAGWRALEPASPRAADPGSERRLGSAREVSPIDLAVVVAWRDVGRFNEFSGQEVPNLLTRESDVLDDPWGR